MIYLELFSGGSVARQSDMLGTSVCRTEINDKEISE